jgi:molecular chaperone HscB
MRNHFEVMGLQAAYHLSLPDLERRYHALSKELHPDRHAQKTPRERLVALERTTELNLAYKVLKDDVKRAEYLLRLSGIEVAEERPSSEMTDERTRVDPAFLMQIMELREELAEAKAAGDGARVKSLADQVRGRAAESQQGIDQAFRGLEAGDDSRLRAIAQALIALRYYGRFLDEVAGDEP